MPTSLDFALLVAAFMAACAVVDYRTRKIPNWLTVPAALAAIGYHALTAGGAGALFALAGLAVGFGLLLLPWLLGGGGMGDVKMLAALGAWLGPLGILVAFGLGAVIAAVGAMGIMASSLLFAGFGATRDRYVGAAAATGRAPRKGKRVLPFAVPMALGAWLMLLWQMFGAAI